LPYWGIGCKIDEKINVKPPLKISRYVFKKTAQTLHTGSSDSLAGSVKQLISFMESKGYAFAGPTVIFWPENEFNIKPENRHFEVIIPIQNNINDLIIQILLFLGVFLCLFIAFFLLSNKKSWSLPNMIFAVMLIAYALGRTEWLLYYQKSLTYSSILHFKYYGDVFYILSWPLMLFYIQALTIKAFKFRPVHLLHLIPCLFFLIEVVFRFTVFDLETKEMLIRNSSISRIIPKTESKIIEILIELQRYLILVLMLVAQKKYKRELKNSFSSIKQIRLTWLSIIIYSKIIIQIITFIKHNTMFITGTYDIMFVHSILISDLVFFLILLYKGMQRYEIFSTVEKNNRKQNWTLPQHLFEHYETKLGSYMETEKPYLNPALTLEELAEQLSISPRYLSMVINKTYNQNFFNFINSFRIKEAQKLLTEDGNKKNILNVLYDAGFNSKSVFNGYFRKQTGLTPTEYRKNMLSSN
jgi:AraC-like DNA-binding protein